jgi:hypothetical protein
MKLAAPNGVPLQLGPYIPTPRETVAVHHPARLRDKAKKAKTTR